MMTHENQSKEDRKMDCPWKKKKTELVWRKRKTSNTKPSSNFAELGKFENKKSKKKEQNLTYTHRSLARGSMKKYGSKIKSQQAKRTTGLR